MRYIETRLSRDEIEDEIISAGFEFLCNTYLYDQKREVPDEQIFIERSKEHILWINWIDITWTLYARIDRKPSAKWQKDPITPPNFYPKIFASAEYCEEHLGWLWLKVVYRDGRVEYYQYCSGGEIDEGIALSCVEVLICEKPKIDESKLETREKIETQKDLLYFLGR